MPTINTYDVPATELMSGDQFAWNGTVHTATEMSTKSKYVHVTVEGGRVLRIELDAQLHVSRVEKTNEEKAAEKLAMQTKILEHHMASADAPVDEARDALAGNLVYRPQMHCTDYARLVDAQTVQSIWAVIRRSLGQARDDGETITIVDAVREMIDDITDELIRTQHASRSTSTLCNAVDDLVCDAKIEWVCNVRYLVR